MALIKRGNIWWIAITGPDGIEIRESTKMTDRAQAAEFQALRRAQIKLGIKPQPRVRRPVVGLPEASERYCEENKDNRTIRETKRQLDWFIQQIGPVPLDKIDARTIKAVIAKKASEASPATANRYLAAIRAVLRAAVEWEWIQSAPFVRQYREPAGRVRTLNEDEIKRLLLSMSHLPHLQDIVIFVLATGVRAGAALKLTWDRVQLDKRFCWISAEMSKNKTPICVPLNDAAMAVLERNQGKHHERVFTYIGKPIRAIEHRTWSKCLKRAGIEDFRFHDLRHVWASTHANNGTPLHILQELGGWKDHDMVRRYAHLAPASLAKYAQNAAVR